MPADPPARVVLVTGASGLVGRAVVARLAEEAQRPALVVAADVREPEPRDRLPGVRYETLDVRDPALAKYLERYGVDTVVHLAAIVTPGPDASRERDHAIDVLGTRNVAAACVAARVRQLLFASSGAAYGYHPDNPVPLRESDPLRADESFAYGWHKRLAEEELARCREAHPELAQLVFRIGTILGARVASPISALFERPVVIGLAGAEAPFVLVWDEDVAACIAKGIRERRSGVYNLAGAGAIPLREIAARLGRPYLPVPGPLLAGALRLLHAAGISPRGAEQVGFLRYRPVLSNEKLVRELGYRPLSSDTCLDRYRRLWFAA